MVENNGESGESHRGMITAKIKEVSREVVCEEIAKCTRGVRQEEQIKNHEEAIGAMKSDIAKGFEDLNGKITQLFNSRFEDAKAETGEVKEKVKFTIEQGIAIVFGLVGVAAFIVQIIRG